MSKQKKKNKKLIKAIIIFVLVVVVAGAAIWVVRNTGIGKSADVYSIKMLNVGFFGDSSSLSGVVTDGKIQKITKKNAIIDKVNVNVGDTVSVGDVLFVYDTSSYQIQIKQDEADIAVAKASINQAQVDIAKYQGLKPYEDAPEPEIKIIDHGELVIKKELTAADLSDYDPTKDSKEFICSAETIIRQDFLKTLRDYEYSVALKLYNEDQIFYGYYYIDGEVIPEYIYRYEEIKIPEPTTQAVPEEETTTAPETTSGDVTYRRVKTDAIYEDWILENVLSFDGEGVIVDTTGDHTYYGIIAGCTPAQYERYETEIIMPENPGGDEDYIYTKAEIAEMISELQEQISEYQLKLRQAEIQYAEDLLTSETGEVNAKINGVVEKLEDVTTAAEGSEIMVVKGESNYTINVYVNELDLDKYKVGDEFDIYAYESGATVTAKVEEIGTEPASSFYSYGMNNPNSSYYPLICVAESTEVNMTVGESCSATPISNGEQTDTICIELMFVRTDNNGSYVMKSVDGKLKKQYVKTGKNFYGSYVEIKEGLTTDDYIAFPYDTGEKEGVKTVVSEELNYN